MRILHLTIRNSWPYWITGPCSCYQSQSICRPSGVEAPVSPLFRQQAFMDWPSMDDLWKRLSSTIFALKRIKTTSTAETLNISYHALFKSRLRYGIQLWSSASPYNIKRVLVLQKRALRVMTGLSWKESCQEPFKQWHILTLWITTTYWILLACSKGHPKNGDAHHYNAWHAGDLNLPAHPTQWDVKRKSSYTMERDSSTYCRLVKNTRPKLLKSKLNEWCLLLVVTLLLQHQRIHWLAELLKQKNWNFLNPKTFIY
jgi:hypothetical protein